MVPQVSTLVITFDPGDGHLERLRDEFPEIEIIECLDKQDLPSVLPGAQLLVGAGLNAELLANGPDLRWVHSQGTGVDGLLFPELVESEVLVTNNSGVQASNMAEHLLAMMLAFARGLPDLIRAQMRSTWVQPLRAQTTNQADFLEHPTFELGYQTLAIVGLGSVGRGLAARAKPLGMTVTGFKRRPDRSINSVDRLYGPNEWHTMLAEADHVAICLPLTNETARLIGTREFAAMKSTAFIYNVGRGETIDQHALIEALQTGEIGGAGLDVTSPEPLPTDSPLWTMQNVMITSHTSGLSPHRWERGIELLIDNIHRFHNGQPLRNLVDKHAGY
jgi:D-2-hydroxyacid dehydrogenase (NADP+)